MPWKSNATKVADAKMNTLQLFARWKSPQSFLPKQIFPSLSKVMNRRGFSKPIHLKFPLTNTERNPLPRITSPIFSGILSNGKNWFHSFSNLGEKSIPRNWIVSKHLRGRFYHFRKRTKASTHCCQLKREHICIIFNLWFKTNDFIVQSGAVSSGDKDSTAALRVSAHI